MHFSWIDFQIHALWAMYKHYSNLRAMRLVQNRYSVAKNTL
jgi:hypothetical protein